MEGILSIIKNKYYLSGMTLSILYLLRTWYNGPKTNLSPNVNGKVVIITGSSDGIGKVTAIELLKNGATVIFACRDKAKTESVIANFSSEVQERAIFMKLDLSDFSSIKNFLVEFLSQFSHLDILINNAGSVFKDFSNVKNGIESTLQINTIGPVILTQGLLEILHKSKGRIINVASRSYKNWIKNDKFYENIKPEEYEFEKNSYSGYRMYCYSKLGNIYFTQYLSDFVEEKKLNIKIGCLHPGTIMTEIARDYTGFLWTFIKLFSFPMLWFLTKTPKMGIQTTLHLCYLPDKDFKNGEYYQDCGVYPLKSHATNKKYRDAYINLFREIIKIYGKNDGVTLISI